MIKKAAILFLVALLLCCLQQAEQKTELTSYFKSAKEIGRVDLVITNLGYSEGSEKLIDDFYREIVALGSPDVMFMHTSYDKPFFVAFFNKTSGKLCYVEEKRRAVENVSYEYVLANANEWNEKMKAKVFSGYEFALIGFTQLYSNSAPHQLLKSAEFHNHACPGLLSGYLIAEKLKELKKNYKDMLLIFSVPPWCKDDALQTIFDVTVGKKGMFVRVLSDEESKAYPNIAGIYVFYNESKKEGKGFILTFDFESVRKNANVSSSDYAWLQRVKQNQWILKNLEESKKLVGVLGEFEVNEELLLKLQKMNFTIQELLGGEKP